MARRRSAAPRGNRCPSSDRPGWTLIHREDFNTPFAVGQYRNTFGITWDRYHNAGASVQDGLYEGVYRLDLTASAGAANNSEDGALRIRCHKVTGQTYAWVGAPTPWDGSPQLYGRYAMRFKTTPTTNQDFKMAWLLWPTTEVWADGEIDFPECDLGSSIGGYSHNVVGNPSANVLAYQNGGISSQVWHTAVIEWTPTRVTFLVDGAQVAQTTNSNGIPKVPMRWVLQTETNLDRPHAIAAGSEASVYCDWIAVYSYTP